MNDEVKMSEYIKNRFGESSILQKKISEWCKNNPEKLKKGFTIDEICDGIGMDSSRQEDVESIELVFESMRKQAFEIFEQMLEGSVKLEEDN